MNDLEECPISETIQNLNTVIRKLLSTPEDNMSLATFPVNITESPPAELSEGCPTFEMAHKYYIPFLITVGLVGNFLSFVVFLTTHLKMRSSSYYLAALATADFGFLTTLLLVYLSNETRIEFFNKPGWCQWLIYISSACAMLSAWFTVAFTVERFIAVQYPLQRPRMCTVSRAKTIVLFITLITLSSQAYVFVTAGVVKPPKQQNTTSFNSSQNDSSPPQREICDVRPEYYEFMKVVSVIDTVVSLFFPFVLIVVMNAMIVRNLLVFRQQFTFNRNLVTCVVYHTTSSQQNSQQNVNEKCVEASAEENQLGDSDGVQSQWGSFRNFPFFSSTSKRSGSNRSLASRQSKQQTGTPTTTRSFLGNIRKAKTNDGEESICIQMNSTSGRNTTAVSTKNQQNITKLLLLISSMFILLNLPSYITRIYIFFFFSIWNENVPYLLYCIQQTSMVLYYTNFSVNFLLYAFCGGTFRRCLNQMMRKHSMKIINFVRTWFMIRKKDQYQQRTPNNVERRAERLPVVQE